jgi:predicted dinucleotide-binding enzyme
MGSGAGHPHIAVVGATGTVGSQIAELLGARAFVYDDLKLFSFTGTTDAVQIAEQTVPVKAFTSPDDLNQSDIIFLAIPRDAADSIAALVKHAVLIDLSQNTQPGSHARSFVAPGLTSRERLRELRGHSNRIADMIPVAQVIASVFQAIGLK